MEVEDRGVFEWVADWKTLGPRLSPAHLGLSPAARVIDVGCGTSTLPLHLASMYACVTGVDREEHCASSMTAQYGERDDLRWITCDVTAPELDASLLPYGCADLVVDKGMLDCALTEDIAAPLLCNVARLLSEGGVYAVISFRKLELLEPLLRCEALPWSVESEALPPSADGARVSLCLMRKCLAVDDASLPSSVAHHINATMDEWYMHEAPLLTAEREGALRESWSAAAASLRTAAAAKGVTAADVAQKLPTDHLPLAVAFHVLFTVEERNEIGYDGFLSDLAAMTAGTASGSGAEQTVASVLHDSISLEDALAYLRAEQ